MRCTGVLNIKQLTFNPIICAIGRLEPPVGNLPFSVLSQALAYARRFVSDGRRVFGTKRCSSSHGSRIWFTGNGSTRSGSFDGEIRDDRLQRPSGWPTALDSGWPSHF